MLLRHCSLRNGSCFKTSLYYRRAFGSLRSTPETFTRLATNSSSKHQIYISKADDPFLNLSIEHYLLQNSPANSTVLFLYINRPCIVIGRNQNPWLEANLNALRKTDLVGQPLGGLTGSNHFTTSSPIALLRRRSGGGTVFHDHGNVNYSVICPTHVFSRDKHAEMVVRAIRKDNLRARVTERHDIVLDQGDLLPQHEMPPGSDTHRSNYHSNIALKVSGSAYKLTRNRSLHHGTCLINSLNVGNISRILRSPASPFIKARGVDSVRSPVGNVYTRDTMGSVTRFQGNVIEAYTELYGLDKEVNSFLGHEASGTSLTENGGVTYGFLGDDLALVDKIQSGIRELTSPEWVFGQTPMFTFSNVPTEEDPRSRPLLSEDLSSSTRVSFQARSGVIQHSSISFSDDNSIAAEERVALNKLTQGIRLHEMNSWSEVFEHGCGVISSTNLKALSRALDSLFGKQLV